MNRQEQDLKEITEAIVNGRYTGETTNGTTWNIVINWNDEEHDPRTELMYKRWEFLHKQCAPAPFIPHPHY